MHKRRISLPAALLLIFTTIMGKVIVLHFKTRDDILKIKVSDSLQLQTVKQLSEYLSQQSHKLGTDNFAIELIDTTGKFNACDGNCIIKWRTNFLTVLVVDLTERLQIIPFLSIDGRAFDTSCGLAIRTVNETISIIRIKEREQAELGTGLITWDGAIVLAKYFEIQSSEIRNKNILELGAGTGVAGMAAALLGAKKILLTDLPYTLDNLRLNVEQNLRTFLEHHDSVQVEVAPLDWSDSSTYRYPTSGPGPAETGTSHSTEAHAGVDDLRARRDADEAHATRRPVVGGGALADAAASQWDLVIGADVVWLEELVPLLVRALSALCGEHTQLLLAHQKRSKRTDSLLFSSLDAFFDIEEIPHSEYHPQYQVGKISIFRGRRRQENRGVNL